MKNFAEEITYWYFRLNGFFLLDNYVSHESDRGGVMHADNDLIGIRLSNVQETIGLASSEDVCPILRTIIPNIMQKSIGLICEVKGGKGNVSSINENKVISCIKRLGLIDRELVDAAVSSLSNCGLYENNSVEIHKIFVSKNQFSSLVNWQRIDFEAMTNFIKNRISSYGSKVAGWNHYDSALLQYLLYEGRSL